MLIALFRHGHKDFVTSYLQSPTGMTTFDNPPLSAKGFQQAEQIKTEVAERRLPMPNLIWVSQLQRTLQTFTNVSQFSNCNPIIRAELNCHSSGESAQNFRIRITQIITEISQMSLSNEHAQTVLYLCSHYDWIEEALLQIPCTVNLNSFEYSSWSPAQYLVLNCDQPLWTVQQFGHIRK